MRSYLAHIVINLKLTARDRLVLFFNYAFPLALFFVFAQSFEARQGGAITQVATMVPAAMTSRVKATRLRLNHHPRRPPETANP